MDKVSVSFCLDKRRTLNKGTYPIKLRVICKRQSRFYKTSFACSEQEFTKIFAPRPRNEYKQVRLQLAEIEKQALKIISELTPFSFESFKEKMFHTTSKKGQELKEYFQEYIKLLKAEKRIKTALTYEVTLKSLLKFKKNIKFKDLTPTFLKKYEMHELAKGNSLTSVGFNLRNLRAIVNLALKSGDFEATNYPFGRNGYTIPKGRNIKKALSESEIKALVAYTPTSSKEAFAKDMFLFSFYCNGINLKDIALLQWQNVEGNKVTFLRAKTAKTSQEFKPIITFLNEKAMQILNKYATNNKSPENFVFPIFDSSLSPEKQVKVLSQTLKNINKYLGRIAKNLGINKPLTTYVARHSFATYLKRQNISTEIISEALGHKSLATTESYLDSFEDHTKKVISELLENIV